MQTFIENTRSLSWLIAAALIVQFVPLSTLFAREDARTSNVRFEISGDKVVIHYDLVGPPDETYIVVVQLKKESDKTFSYSPRNLSGDAGEGRFAGTGRKAIWDIKKEFPQGLVGTDYYFVVKVVPVSSGSNLFLWIGGGVAAVAGGLAAILLLSKSTDDQAGGSGSFPSPPGRP